MYGLPEEGSLPVFLKLCATTLHRHLRVGFRVLIGGTAVFIRESCIPVEVDQLISSHL